MLKVGDDAITFAGTNCGKVVKVKIVAKAITITDKDGSKTTRSKYIEYEVEHPSGYKTQDPSGMYHLEEE